MNKNEDCFHFETPVFAFSIGWKSIIGLAFLSLAIAGVVYAWHH